MSHTIQLLRHDAYMYCPNSVEMGTLVSQSDLRILL